MMRAFFSRLFRPSQSRSFDAAGGGRRWDGAKVIANLNSSMDAANPAIRQRGGYYARNNAWLARGINAHVANIIGTGIRPQSRHPDAQMRKILNDSFERWTMRADLAGMSDFYGLQLLICRSMIETGEAFLRFRIDLDARHLPLRLQMIAADQVDATLHRDLTGGGRIRAGVEFSADGKRVAYHILPNRPGDVVAVSWTPVRVPASEILHVFEPLEAGQVRGLSWLAPVLLKVHELDTYEDAQLVRQKVAALFAGFLIDPNGDAAGFDGNQSGSILESGLEPGTLKVLPPGYDIRFSDPAEVGNTSDFIKSQLRAIAAGLGVTYEQMTGDLSGVNYSSIRAGLVEYRRRVDALRWAVLIPQLCRPVWERFIQTAALSGLIPLDEFSHDPDAFLAADWHPPAWDWVDPSKDIQAEIAAVDAGFKARSQVISERGEDPEQVDALRGEDAKRSEKLGLNSAKTAPANDGRKSGNTAPEEETEKEEKDAA